MNPICVNLRDFMALIAGGIFDDEALHPTDPQNMPIEWVRFILDGHQYNDYTVSGYGNKEYTKTLCERLKKIYTDPELNKVYRLESVRYVPDMKMFEIKVTSLEVVMPIEDGRITFGKLCYAFNRDNYIRIKIPESSSYNDFSNYELEGFIFRSHDTIELY